MKLSLVQSKLAKALTTVSRAVTSKSTLPILSHVALHAEKGRLRISATNLEIGVNYYIGGKIDKAGETTVPARIFTEFVTNLKDEKLTLEQKNNELNIKGESSESNFSTVSAEEFPLIPDIKDAHVISIKGSELKEAITMVSFAAAVDETRPVLSGILMRITDGKLIMGATDSYRLAEKVIQLPKGNKAKLDVIVPAKTLIELNRILAEVNEDVDIFASASQIAFVMGDVELVSRLIEGQFPNYLQIIPESTSTKAELITSDFAQGIKISYLFAREAANTVKVKFTPPNEIVIESQAQAVGNNVLKLKANLEGDAGEISFNAKYLIDVLGVIKDDKVKFEISGKLNPGLIRPAKDTGYLYIIMPLRS